MKRFIKAAALFTALAVVLTAAGCGSVDLSKPKSSTEGAAVSVTGSCDIAVNGDKITVSGTTDILDGAILYISVLSQDGKTRDSVKITKAGGEISQEFAITAEKYDDSVKSVTGYITCAPSLYGNQPDNVYTAYGRKFENVTAPEGDLVWNKDGVIIVFGSKSVDLNQ